MKKTILFQFACTLLIASYGHAQVTFTSQTTPTTATLKSISFADTSIGYACGDAGTILKTINGGATWTTVVSGTAENLWDIKVIPNSGGQKVITVGDNNTVRKSVNGGATWSAQSIPFQSGSFVFGVQCLDSSNYFACGGDFATFSGAVLKTTNGGTTWTKSPVAGSVFLDKIFMLNNSNGFAVGTNTSFSDGSIQKTTTGNTFNTVKTSPSIITNLYCISASDVIVVGLNGQIWKTTDAGSTWISHSFNTVDLYGIKFIDSLNGFACGGSPTGSIILQTLNGGITWSQINFNFTGSFQSIEIIGNKIFIAGDNGKIITSTLSLPTGIINSDSENEFTIYPNPMADNLNITIPVKFFGSELIIYDILGNELYRTRLQNQNTLINSQDLPFGLYNYSLTYNGETVKSGKILKQ